MTTLLHPDSPYGFGQLSVGEVTNSDNMSHITGLPSAWERVQILWDTIELVNNAPNPPIYHWAESGCDDAIDAMVATGTLNIDFCIQGAPAWHRYTPSGCGGCINPFLPDDGAQFAKDLLDHYTARYGYCPISAIECGNEGYTACGLGNADCNDPGYGLPFLKATWQKIKPTYPNVLIGSMCTLTGGYRGDPAYNFPQTWWGIFCSGNSPKMGNLGYGGTQYCDFVCHHYYPGANDPINPASGHLSFPDWWKAIRDAMASANKLYGYPIVPLWITECGWTASNTPTGNQVTPAQQSQYFQELLDSARTSGVVTHVLYFNVHGLYLDNGDPRPAYTMEQAYVQQYPQWSTPPPPPPPTTSPYALRILGASVDYSVGTSYIPDLSTYAELTLGWGPQAYYRMDEQLGTTTHDISGNSHNGSVTTDTLLAQPGLLVGEPNTSMKLTATGGFALPGTFRPDLFATSAVRFWALKSGHTVPHLVHIITTGGTSGVSLVYIDGTYQQTIAGLAPFTGSIVPYTTFTQGLLTWGSLAPFDGWIDELAIFSYALSGSQMITDYQAGLGNYVQSIQAETYTVTVDAVPVDVEAGTLLIDRAVGKITEASFTLWTDTSTHYQQYQQTAVYDPSGVLVFSGYLNQPTEFKPGFQPELIHGITCIDQTWLAKKRRVAAAYTNKTCGYMAQDIEATVLAQEGVTVGQIYDGLTPSPHLYPGPLLFPNGNIGPIPQATFVYCTVAEALDKLVEQASSAGVPYYWMIDQNKKFYFVPYTMIVGPTIDGTTIDDGHLSGMPPKVTRANPSYRNGQYILGGMQQTGTQDETRKGDGNTRAFTFSYPLAQAPSTFTVNSATKTLGLKGTSGSQYYWAQGDPVIAQDTGQTILTSADTMHMIYIGEFPAVIYDQNAAQVNYQANVDGTSGIIEDVMQDTTITSLANGLVSASALLTRYGVQGMLLEFMTLSPNYAPGQLCLAANLQDLGILDGTQLLIESVTGSDQQDNLNIWWNVKAISGPYDTTWVDFYSRQLAQGAPANSINVGLGQSVQILVNFSGSFTPNSVLNVSVFSCPVPSSTLHPSGSLFPC